LGDNPANKMESSVVCGSQKIRVLIPTGVEKIPDKKSNNEAYFGGFIIDCMGLTAEQTGDFIERLNEFLIKRLRNNPLYERIKMPKIYFINNYSKYPSDNFCNDDYRAK
jgi:hypothetical protein